MDDHPSVDQVTKLHSHHCSYLKPQPLSSKLFILGYPDDYPDDNKGWRNPNKNFYPGSRFPTHYLPGDERYPPPGGGRPYYPPPGGPPDRYPSDRYPPGERYPTVGDRYPVVDRYPMDRYPAGDRYPMGDRYPIGDRYPTTDDRYPMRPGGGGRYPPSRPPPGLPPLRPGNRFPGVIHRYPVVTSLDRPGGYPPPPRYPVGTTGFPPPDDRYPPPPPVTPLDRYPLPDDPPDRYPSGLDGNRLPERYPASDRYPDKDGYPYNDR